MKCALIILLISISLDICCAQDSANTSKIQISNTVVKTGNELLDFYAELRRKHIRGP